jgi:hypothetical protein
VGRSHQDASITTFLSVYDDFLMKERSDFMTDWHDVVLRVTLQRWDYILSMTQV